MLLPAVSAHLGGCHGTGHLPRRCSPVTSIYTQLSAVCRSSSGGRKYITAGLVFVSHGVHGRISLNAGIPRVCGASVWDACAIRVWNAFAFHTVTGCNCIIVSSAFTSRNRSAKHATGIRFDCMHPCAFACRTRNTLAGPANHAGPARHAGRARHARRARRLQDLQSKPQYSCAQHHKPLIHICCA